MTTPGALSRLGSLAPAVVVALLLGGIIVSRRRDPYPVPPISPPGGFIPDDGPAPSIPEDSGAPTAWGWSSTNAQWLARTMLGEAGTPNDFPEGVATVVINRARRDRRTIRAVVTEREQFAVWRPLYREDVSPAEREVFDRITRPVPPHSAWPDYLIMAEELLDGRRPLVPELRDCLHFVARWYWETINMMPLAQVPPQARWLRQMEEIPLSRRWNNVFLRPRTG